ncbi:protein prenylyltransferase [Phlegmacium glaucopus]|nr:protein prenylyltransferase [Phlegmacium glaucopus]
MANFSESPPEDSPLLFCERPDWADVTPLEQYETITPIAPIIYTEEYKDATNYLRAVVKSGEKSQRVLELTEVIIRLNPAHYSAWQYRYETLIALSAPLAPELALMDELAINFLKTYQVWQHRRLLVTITRKAGQELAFIKKVLAVDEKNYHTWSYRQWILTHFGGGAGESQQFGDNSLWVEELDLVDCMLINDIRNNSAWHHRFFVVYGCGIRQREEDRGHVFKRELTYVKQSISLVPNNPAAWNYLRGILDHNSQPFSSIKDFIWPYTIPSPAPGNHSHTASRDIVDLENPPPAEGAELPVPAAIEFMADIWEKEGTKEGLDKASEFWKSLAMQHDTVHKKYWEYRIRDARAIVKAGS